MALQRPLPGLDSVPFRRYPPAPAGRRPLRRESATVAARARADHAYADWRNAFSGFLRRLPPCRRAELRRRLFGKPSRPRSGAAPPVEGPPTA